MTALNVPSPAIGEIVDLAISAIFSMILANRFDLAVKKYFPKSFF